MLPILHQSFWRDEAFSMLLSLKSPLEIITLTAKDFTPPLFYIVLHYWILLFGNSEPVVRALSFQFHVLTTVVVFFIARKLIRYSFPQVLIALACFLNPFLLAYAFEARAYTMLTFLVALSIYFLLDKKYVVAGFIISLGIFTHNFAVFTYCSLALYLFLSLPKKENIRKTLEFSLFPAVSLVVWGNILWHQWTKVASGFWITETTSGIFLRTLESYTYGDLQWVSQELLFMVSLVLLFFAFSNWVGNNNEDDKKSALLLFVGAIGPVVITYFVSAFFVPIYHERYLIATAPLLILLTGFSLYRFVHSHPRLQLYVVAFVAGYFILLWQLGEYTVQKTTKPAINYGVNQVLEQALPNDVIIPKDVLNFLEVKYYVMTNGSKTPVFAFVPKGEIPFYIGSILYDKKDIIRTLPKEKTIWEIESDGGYKKILPK